MIPPIPDAGDIYSISCIVDIIERFVYELNSSTLFVSIDQKGVNSTRVVDVINGTTEGLVMKNDSVYTRILTFDEIKTSDARTYYCVAIFLELNVTAYVTSLVSVRSKFAIVSNCDCCN